jgi:hypothetical protein
MHSAHSQMKSLGSTQNQTSLLAAPLALIFLQLKAHVHSQMKSLGSTQNQTSLSLEIWPRRETLEALPEESSLFVELKS